MKDKDLAVFCTQLALVLKSGIALHEGVAMMLEDIERGDIKVILEEVGKELNKGKTLDKALVAAGTFPEYMIHMVEVGTQSGRLEDVMKALSYYYEREEYLKQSIKSAIFYPLILSSMMLAVMLILSIKVLPVFQEVFNNLGGEMSQVAQSFMQFGIITSRYIYVIIISVILAASAVIGMIKTKKGKCLTKRLIRKLKITEKISTARFAAAMSLMMASGLDTEEALKMASKLIDNEKIRAKVKRCELRLEEGHSFINVLSDAEVFSKIATRMLALGMKTGNVDGVMKQIADAYEQEVQGSLSKRVAIIEPVAVGVLAIMIGSILISVMLPLMGIMSSIG